MRATTHRRWHFYEKQAQDDPWFDRVRAQDVYGIIAVTHARIEADVAASGASGHDNHHLPLATAESLFSGLAALSTTLQMDVVPARLTGVAAIKEGVEGVALQPLVFQRERTDVDSERFEPMTVDRLLEEVRLAVHAAGWGLPPGVEASQAGCLNLTAKASSDVADFITARVVGLSEGDARVRTRQIEVAVQGVPEALRDVEALIGMLLAEDDFVVKS